MDKKIKKYILIIVIVFFIIISVLFSVEVLLYIKEAKYAYTHFQEKLKYSLKRKDFSVENTESYYRKPCGLQYKKPPVLIYGCSFAYGGLLNENEHVGYLLSEYTKRPVYNFGMGGKGPWHALYLLQNQTLELSKKPEYLLYIFIDDHIRRMYMTCGVIDDFNFFSYEKNGDNIVLKEQKFKYLKNCLTYKYFEKKFYYKFFPKDKKFKLLKFFLQQMKDTAEKKYPGIKFVFIIYDVIDDFDFNIDDKMIKQIKDMGIDVIRLSEVIEDFYNPKYSEESKHPTADAWKNLVPEIVKIEKM